MIVKKKMFGIPFCKILIIKNVYANLSQCLSVVLHDNDDDYGDDILQFLPTSFSTSITCSSRRSRYYYSVIKYLLRITLNRESCLGLPDYCIMMVGKRKSS